MKRIRLVPRLGVFFALLIFAAACNYPTGEFPSTEQIITSVVGTLTAEATNQPQATVAPPVLPHSVYFLSDRGGTTQVWKLAADGSTLTQVTNEAMDVDDFDVSTADGSVAYVSGNRLTLFSADGTATTILDNSAAQSDAADYYYNQLVKSPRFSPDGKTLAYALDGIYFYDMESGQSTQILPNDVKKQNGSVTANELYAPLAWSPDGTQLLVEIAKGEGSLLAVLRPGADPLLTKLQASGSFCCQAVWAPDSRSVLVASPYLGLVESGLWRYDARTGGEITLIDSYSENVYNFVGWPLQVADGSLRYFYTSSTEVPQGNASFFMLQSGGDGVSGRNQLRPESFNLLEALWAPDGSLALVVQSSAAGGNSGPVALVFSDGRPVQGLLDDGRDLRWGP